MNIKVAAFKVSEKSSNKKMIILLHYITAPTLVLTLQIRSIAAKAG